MSDIKEIARLITEDPDVDLEKVSQIAVRCILEMKARLEAGGWSAKDINDFANNALYAIELEGFDIEACWD
jgi:hypothetical protein